MMANGQKQTQKQKRQPKKKRRKKKTRVRQKQIGERAGAMEGGQETDFKVLHPVTLAFVDGDGEVRKRDGRARRKMSVSSIEWIRDGGRRQADGWRVCTRTRTSWKRLKTRRDGRDPGPNKRNKTDLTRRTEPQNGLLVCLVPCSTSCKRLINRAGGAPGARLGYKRIISTRGLGWLVAKGNSMMRCSTYVA